MLALVAGCSIPGAAAGEGRPAPTLDEARPGPTTLAGEVREGAADSAAKATAPRADESATAPAPPAPPASPVLGPLEALRAAIAEGTPRPARQWAYIAAEAGAACRDELKATGARFRALPDIEKPNRNGCGVPHGVLLTRGPTGISYSPPLQIDCSLALKLVDIERIIQEEAEAHLGSQVSRVVTLGSYACRAVVGRMAGWSGGISEHSFGNAIDIARFEPKRGRAASVLQHYHPGVPSESPESRFLRSITRRLRRDGAVTRVLGPDFDASHRDHLHLDRGTPWWW